MIKLYNYIILYLLNSNIVSTIILLVILEYMSVITLLIFFHVPYIGRFLAKNYSKVQLRPANTISLI